MSSKLATALRQPGLRRSVHPFCCGPSIAHYSATASQTTPTPESGSTFSRPTRPNPASSKTTHYRITLRRSAIALGKAKQATLVTLGLHRRFQTVYHPHTPDIAGKILAVKELLEVQNVAPAEVRTKEEMTRERRATRGFRVVGRRLGVVGGTAGAGWWRGL
ncbi:hypothetical protein GLOTRDRAFT_62535 [Gloeophyllum trabeum ATCC 11539]|uniref:Large ribosomal subunit protein uL30m n=1 Tax=Gloeophyllum trabeum (strain ATCC 11539 / FP-39264 / Madison 617) TaxID=670483 RepID=S7RMX6_GLOTA|nr:uncharacterized protein GLOTRDRAFT_62535 [Gloeophyllum trabeum ATCC 11539]EPQ54054.1 hypothetical protein GLOTRDRAFT_62535 [Gloeophyllum trabeum ATCC 11539]